MSNKSARDLVNRGQAFNYHVASLKDLKAVKTDTYDESQKPGTKKNLTSMAIEFRGEQYNTSSRFWNSLATRVGIGVSVFNIMDYQEFFDRVSSIGKLQNARLVEDSRKKQLLGISDGQMGLVRFNELMGVLSARNATDVEYHDGVISSTHTLPHAPGLDIAGEEFVPKIVVETPIDGFGDPNIFLSMLRLVCANGMIARSTAFRTRVQLARTQGSSSASFQLARVFDSFSNDEGFDALAERIQTSRKTWLSLNEAHRVLEAIAHIKAGAVHTQALSSFQQLTGDLSKKYGIVSLDQLSRKMRCALSTGCTIYDAINFTTELATHKLHAQNDAVALKRLHGAVGTVVSNRDGFDLEGIDTEVLAGKKYPDFYLQTA